MKTTALLFATLLTLAHGQAWYNTERDTLYISTETQLRELSTLVSDGTNGTSNFTGKTIILENDISLWGNFVPIGNGSTRTFNGTFDGQGYTISGLSINGGDYAGLFGYVGTSGQIKNVNVIAAKIKTNTTSGGKYAGGLAAYYNSSKPIENCSAAADSVIATGSSSYSGGLVGYIGSSGKIINSYATGNVSGSYSGGLIGEGYNNSIEYCHATGNVSGSNYSGGLVGYGYGNIEYSYATGNVSNKYSYNSASGGLIGYGSGVIFIINSYATGNISDTTTATSNSYYSHSGGLVGYAGSAITISNSYARGNVSAYATNSSNSASGGLVGYANSTIAISNSYASGNNSAINAGTGYNYSGGILGFYNSNDFLYKSVYYNLSGANMAIGSGISTGISGLSSEGLKQRMNFIDWNFDYTWNIDEYENYPYLVVKNRGAILSVPVLANKTHNSITINPIIASTGQAVEYTITTNITAIAGNIVPADITEWKTTLTFANLNPYTVYYIFARAKENANYNTGKISAYLGVQTDPETNADSNSSSSLGNGSSSSGGYLGNSSSPSFGNSSSSSNGGSQIYEYCVFIQDRFCLNGSYENCPTGGILSNNCPFEETPIRLSQISISNIIAKAVGNSIVLENLPPNAKVGIYNLQGKRVYSTINPENPKILRIGVQTKGIYIVKTTFGSETKMLRVVVR